MTNAQLTKSLKAEATRLGFDFCGCAPAINAPGFEHLQDWIENGYAGEMAYISNRLEAYEHPRHVLDGAKSLLLLGMNYKTARPNPPTPGAGRIARYAWGESDYHDLIHGLLKQLCKYAGELMPEATARGVVDTAPLLERQFAQLAGLGWKAKNTLLINREMGSFFFLAALLVDVELEYDQPFETDHCGTCTACLDACPTDAFVGPNILDATKCISYLTIEHRSPVPMDLRPKIEDWLFGCDVCQDVCPWNTKPAPTTQLEFQPRDGQNPIDLCALFNLTDEQFRKRFRETPLWRSKRRGILRNAAIALGNNPNDGAIEALKLGLADPEPLVRGASAWALGNIASHRQKETLQIKELLTEGLAKEADPIVMQEIDGALNNLSDSNQTFPL